MGHQAVLSSQFEVFDILVASKADVNLLTDTPNAEGGSTAHIWSPLARAVHTGNTEMVKKLLECGADSEQTFSSLFHQMHNRSHGIIKYVMTPLALACAKRQMPVAKLLVESKASLESKITAANGDWGLPGWGTHLE